MSDDGIDYADYPVQLATTTEAQTPRVSKKVEYPHKRNDCRYDQIRESGPCHNQQIFLKRKCPCGLKTDGAKERHYHTGCKYDRIKDQKTGNLFLILKCKCSATQLV